jgi:hypothetical protein
MDEKHVVFAGDSGNGMNGHYAAGVLEGIAHFFPETTTWY